MTFQALSNDFQRQLQRKLKLIGQKTVVDKQHQKGTSYRNDEVIDQVMAQQVADAEDTSQEFTNN